LAAWRYPESFDQLMFCLRLGNRPQCVITTTPKPTKLIKTLVARDDVYLVTGNTFENEDNLAESALESFRNLYEGTTLGRQELYAEIVENIEGALWTYDQLENIRINKSDLPDLNRIVVAKDPAMTASSSSDETGIIIAGRFNNRYYVIDDVSGKYTADGWARKAIECYYKYKADKIIAETNNGGDMVEHTLRTVDKNISYKKVTATRGKMLRAEPIHALYEQKKVYHVGVLSQLETQMTSYTGETKESPDRLDALVWALTELNTSSGNAIWRIN